MLDRSHIIRNAIIFHIKNGIIRDFTRRLSLGMILNSLNWSFLKKNKNPEKKKKQGTARPDTS